MNLFRLIFGSKNDRDVKKIRPVVARINEVEAGLQKLSDDDLRAKTAAWKAELAQIEDKAELAAKLEQILPEAFAVVKTTCRRLCGQSQLHCLCASSRHLCGGAALRRLRQRPQRTMAPQLQRSLRPSRVSMQAKLAGTV